MSTTPSNAPPAPAQSLAKKLISFPVMIATLIVGAIFIPLRDFGVDPDLWWHLKVGATILSTHHFPTKDIYSFTAYGSPWIAYEWLGEVLLALANHAAGLRGLMALDLGLTIAILLSLYALATIRSGNSKAAGVACVVVLPLVYVSLTLRPQMFGYIFLIWTLISSIAFARATRGVSGCCRRCFCFGSIFTEALCWDFSRWAFIGQAVLRKLSWAILNRACGRRLSACGWNSSRFWF